MRKITYIIARFITLFLEIVGGTFIQLRLEFLITDKLNYTITARIRALMVSLIICILCEYFLKKRRGLFERP